ncbi:mCG1042657, partial [Mus musculus]
PSGNEIWKSNGCDFIFPTSSDLASVTVWVKVPVLMTVHNGMNPYITFLP